jgi:hypothetical protein
MYKVKQLPRCFNPFITHRHPSFEQNSTQPIRTLPVLLLSQSRLHESIAISSQRHHLRRQYINRQYRQRPAARHNATPQTNHHHEQHRTHLPNPPVRQPEASVLEASQATATSPCTYTSIRRNKTIVQHLNDVRIIHIDRLFHRQEAVNHLLCRNTKSIPWQQPVRGHDQRRFLCPDFREQTAQPTPVETESGCAS